MLTGTAATLAELLRAWGERPLVAHDWKTLSRDAGAGARSADGDLGAAPLGYDTAVAAYLIDPARRRYPLDELVDEASIEAGRRGRATDAARRRRCGAACWRADQQRARSTGSSCAACSTRSSCRSSRCCTGSSARG